MIYFLSHKKTGRTSAVEPAGNGLMRIYHDLSRSGGLTINEQTPLTSIRRAISDLTNRNRLVKTDKKVLGGAGRKTYTWRLK